MFEEHGISWESKSKLATGVRAVDTRLALDKKGLLQPMHMTHKGELFPQEPPSSMGHCEALGLQHRLVKREKSILLQYGKSKDAEVNLVIE